MEFAQALVLLALSAAGLDCGSPDPVNGLSCRGRLHASSYPNDIAVFIPASFQPKDRLDLVLHLHGYLNRDGETFDTVLDEFRFDEMWTAAGRDAILVVPASAGANATYRSEITDSESFERFLNPLAQALAAAGLSTTPEVRRIALSAHSGAYKTAAVILETRYRDKIHELYLFDSGYGDHAIFARFARDRRNRFKSVFVPGSRTEAGNRKIWRLLHPGKTEKEFECEPPDGVFIRSDGDHWTTVNKFFPKLLKQ